MAIYEFNCKCCRHRFERLVLDQNKNDRVVCPACGRMDLEKKRSLFAPENASDTSGKRPGPNGM